MSCPSIQAGKVHLYLYVSSVDGWIEWRPTGYLEIYISSCLRENPTWIHLHWQFSNMGGSLIHPFYPMQTTNVHFRPVPFLPSFRPSYTTLHYTTLPCFTSGPELLPHSYHFLHLPLPVFPIYLRAISPMHVTSLSYLSRSVRLTLPRLTSASDLLPHSPISLSMSLSCFDLTHIAVPRLR